MNTSDSAGTNPSPVADWYSQIIDEDPNLGRGAKYDRDEHLSLLEDFDGAPYPEGVQRAFRVRMESTLAELEAAYEVIVFADGVALDNTGMVLADLYNETCRQAEVLRQAGTWPRGSFGRAALTDD